MRLALPLGLIGLSFLVALILIYIFKPKYREKKVSSSYVWKLSLRYRKRKVPFEWLQRSLLFVIQILILSLIGFTMASPYTVIASEDGEKIAILDASASMFAQTEGKTRFERARDEISALARQTVPADRFSVILAGETASFVIRRSDSSNYILQKLTEAECGYTEPDLDGAMKLAEGVLSENPSADVYLFTDKTYTDSGKVRTVDLSKEEWNAAVLGFRAEWQRGRYVFTAKVASRNAPCEAAVSLFVDGKQQLSRLASCPQGGTVDVVWDALDIYDYQTAEVRLLAEDSCAFDNSFVIYGEHAETFKIQLVSADPGFLFLGLSSVPHCRVDRVNSLEEAAREGYDLYVYNKQLPADGLPADGAVWFIDPDSDANGRYGFSVGGKEKGDFYLSEAGGTGETYEALTHGLDPASVKVTEYSRLDSYLYYEKILTCNGDPVLLARQDGGQKFILMTFDVHMSDLPITADFPMLMLDLVSYSVSPTVENTHFLTGERVEINARANAASVTVACREADGRTEQTVYSVFPVTITAALPGEYTVTQRLTTGEERTDAFFVSAPAAESVFGGEEAALPQPIAIGSGTAKGKSKDYDIYIYLAAGILALVIIEWGLQSREQY